MSELTRRFFSRQLKPYYHLIEEFVNFEFIPWGNTKLDGNNFICPKNEDQCMANRIQSVVLDEYWDHEKGDGTAYDGRMRTVNFLSCVFTHLYWTSNIYTASEVCMDEELRYDEYVYIWEEAKSQNGSDLYKVMQQKTDEMKNKSGISGDLELIPFVTLNEIQSRRTQFDLFQTACDLYKVSQLVINFHSLNYILC